MKFLVLDHEDGCTPLRPCRSCAAATFLREKLTPTDFSNFVYLMKETKAPTVGLDESVDVLNLSVRVHNAFANAQIRTIRDLLEKTDGDLDSLPMFGRKSLDEVDQALLLRGRRRGESPPE